MTTAFTNNYAQKYIIAPRYIRGITQLIAHIGNFDCFVISRRSANIQQDEITQIISLIANSTVDWVEVIGFNAEAIHDAIDLASVGAGRQKAVGDGVPMTAWDSDYHADDAVAKYILTGGFGSYDKKLIFYFGTAEQELAFVDAVYSIIQSGPSPETRIA